MDATEMSAEELRALADEKSGKKVVDGGIPARGPRKVTVTALGVTVKVDPERFDDYELLEEVMAAGESAMAFVPLLKAICGTEKEYRRVKDELRDEHGHLRMSRVGEFVEAVQAQVGALKN